MKFNSILAFNFLFCITAFGQVGNDVIYVKNKPKIFCKIHELLPSTVSYESNTGEMNSEDTKNIDLIFFSNGDFQVPGSEKFDFQIENGNDLIILKDGSLIHAKDVEPFNELKEVRYRNLSDLSPIFTKKFDQVVCYIKFSGRHEIFNPLNDEKITILKKVSGTDINKAIQEITPELQSQLQEDAKNKVRSFYEYLNLIADKSLSFKKRIEAQDNAHKLFIEDATIEVSNVNSNEKVYRPILDYLKRVRMISLNNVTFTVKESEILYLSNFKKTDKGYYLASIVATQYFEGFNIDPYKGYRDVTRKVFEVRVYPRSTVGESNLEAGWDVKLGNITVDSTEKF